MDRRADKPHDLTEDETMSQTEKRLFLIRFLLGEQPGYRDIKIPSDERKQRQLLRSLFNMRMPAWISGDRPAEGEGLSNKYTQQY